MTNKEFFDYIVYSIDDLDSILNDVFDSKNIQSSNKEPIGIFIARCINDKLNVFNMVYDNIIRCYLDASKIGVSGENPITKKPLFKLLKGKVYVYHANKIAIILEDDGYSINTIDNPNDIFAKKDIFVSNNPGYKRRFKFPEFAMVYYYLTVTNAWDNEVPNT